MLAGQQRRHNSKLHCSSAAPPAPRRALRDDRRAVPVPVPAPALLPPACCCCCCCCCAPAAGSSTYTGWSRRAWRQGPLAPLAAASRSMPEMPSGTHSTTGAAATSASVDAQRGAPPAPLARRSRLKANQRCAPLAVPRSSVRRTMPGSCTLLPGAYTGVCGGGAGGQAAGNDAGKAGGGGQAAAAPGVTQTLINRPAACPPARAPAGRPSSWTACRRGSRRRRRRRG